MKTITKIVRENRKRENHGCADTKEYSAWESMIQRCCNPKHRSYHRYGGRGIEITPRWFKFTNFLKDLGTSPKGTSLDRIDNSKGYYKKNCRWATKTEQQGNTRRNRIVVIDGTPHCLSAACRKFNLYYPVVKAYRLYHDCTAEQALKYYGIKI